MARLRSALGLVVTMVCLVAQTGAFAEEAPSAEDRLRQVIAAIDERIAEGWRAGHVEPTEAAADSEFLRRVTLDIAGRIPTVAEARRFLGDGAPDKRRQLVDRLLDDPRYVVHFTTVWRKALLPETDADPNTAYLEPIFEGWLRTKLLENTSYQEMVAELLGADVSEGNLYRSDRPSPGAFYVAREIKPENLAAATARTFLGVRIECAQCHDHPFDRWKRRDFWSYAAFFAGLERAQPGTQGVLAGLKEFFGQRTIRIPETDQEVEPMLLDGTPLARGTALKPRQALTEWIVADANPYFAPAAVNRLWGHFFGQGIVDPIDDFSDANPASHPELLGSLSKAFIAERYDLKFLIRAIVLSRPYQLSSRQTDSRQSEGRRFARMPLRGMSADQLYDSLLVATGRFEPFTIRGLNPFGPATPRRRFRELFADLGAAPAERATTVLQSLTMMNGEFIHDATQPDRSRLLGTLIDFPEFAPADQIEVLFLATLSRPPTGAERDELTRFLEQRGTERGRALGDVFWALLNSSEFLYNH